MLPRTLITLEPRSRSTTIVPLELEDVLVWLSMTKQSALGTSSIRQRSPLALPGETQTSTVFSLNEKAPDGAA
ncbi:MAG: hypothetical protein BWZ10_03102 [candidate division BRC1 bacterium ADurb.BinA364]|nr:MAG: hypothetical protein BWZ10_03102 [candidate division BRC1 bacterium ADurb.BinA364]